jgi:hypothetical protein
MFRGIIGGVHNMIWVHEQWRWTVSALKFWVSVLFNRDTIATTGKV